MKKVRGKQKEGEGHLCLFLICLCISTLWNSCSAYRTRAIYSKEYICNFPGTGQCAVDTIWPFPGGGVLVGMLRLIPGVLVSTDAAGQRSDPVICLVRQEQAQSQEREAKSRSQHRLASSCPRLLSPEADAPWGSLCGFRGVREGVAKPVPEVARDIRAVSWAPFVLSFSLSWEMKGSGSISYRALFMHNTLGGGGLMSFFFSKDTLLQLQVLFISIQIFHRFSLSASPFGDFPCPVLLCHLTDI